MNPPPNPPESVLKARLRDEIDAGIAAARDPQNAGLPDLFARVTTIYSPWCMGFCPQCRHVFREGDRVRLCPLCGQAYHDDDQYGLHCWQAHFKDGHPCREVGQNRFLNIHDPGCSYTWPGSFPDRARSATVEQHHARIGGVTTLFLRGLEGIWKPFGQAQVIEVEPGSPLVGRQCPWCRFDIRAGDHVVKCPCGHCNTYIHEDIFRHLTCWSEWNGSQGRNYCPTSGARIERDAPAGEEGGNAG